VDPSQRQSLNAALARLKRGERAAADEVFALAWPAVRSFAQRWLQGSAHADDVAQRALVRVFEQALEYDESRDALAWALEVALWECRTERARVRRARTEGLNEAAEASAAAHRPDEQLEAEELRATLANAMGELSQGDQEELTRLLAGETSGDAASRKRRQRAVERLRTLWRRLHGE
jgi:RNA polymerase sigma-70 factor (ECF subfamily)